MFVRVWAMVLPLPAEAPVMLPAGAIEMVHANVVPGVELVRAILVIPAEHIVCDAGVAMAFGVGFTRTVAVIGVPVHPFAVGVIVNVTVTGKKVVLVSVPVITPLPLAAMPVTVAVLSLVQLNIVPVTLPVKTIGRIGLAEQMVCDAGVAVASGVGFTRTVAVTGNPGHPLAVGVIVNVTRTGAKVVFVSVPLILPVPLAAMPVTATTLSLVQLKLVPATFPVNTIGRIGLAEQMVCEAGNAVTSGVGFTVTITFIGRLVHPSAEGVIV